MKSNLPAPAHERSAPQSGYSVDLWARFIAAVLDHLCIEHAFLVGHSKGVPVIRQFYRRYKQRVDGLVAVDSALWPPYTPQLVAWFRATMDAPDYEKKMAAMAKRMPQGPLPDADFSYLKSKSAATLRPISRGMLQALQDETISSQIRLSCRYSISGVQPRLRRPTSHRERVHP